MTTCTNSLNIQDTSLPSVCRLSDFIDNVKDALTDSEFQETIKNTVASYTGPNAISQISSFAIAIGWAFLGQHLATKKKESPTARFVARILGTGDDAINKGNILRRLKDKNYSDTVRKKILDVIQTSSIDEFARSANLSLSEALETYMQIKEYVIDSEVIGIISRLDKEIDNIAAVISNEAQVLRTAIDNQLNEVSKSQYELYQTTGLSWFRNYFDEHIYTTSDTENWKNGFEFRLPSIMQKKEFRRCALVNQIKGKLEETRRLLLVGESGSSKTTILMEILTDYFVDGYEILYNLDGTEIKNSPQLVSFIEKRLEYGDKILVVVDNVHSGRTSAIFYAMDEIISRFTYIQNIMFLLAAQIPEYDSFVRDRLNLIREGKELIRRFSKDPELRYELSYFTKDDIKGFIKKYDYIKDPNGQSKNITTEEEESLSNYAEKILNETRGHPIMVKFFLLRNGLRTDVERRYNDYLNGDLRKMQTMLVCSLLDIGSLPITDELLQNMGLLRDAYNLENVTLYQPTTGSWKTIHPRWDIELLSILYNQSDKGQICDNKQQLNAALDSIFRIKEDNTNATQERAFAVIGAIYDAAARRVLPIDIIESVINIPSYLNEKKAELYTYYIARAYSALDRHVEAIRSYEEAIRIKPDFAEAWYNKGISLGTLGEQKGADQCFTKARELGLKP